MIILGNTNKFRAQELFTLGQNLGTVRERIGRVSTGLSEEVIMAKMKQRKYSRSTTSSPVDLELCCICQVRNILSSY